jgi:hypothetical protein
MRSAAPQKARLDEPVVRPRWNLIRVLTLVFTVLSIMSLVYISVASANYLSFYPSLADIKQQISSVVYQRDPVGNQMSIVAHVIVENPTDYSGFIVKVLDLKVRFLTAVSSSNATLFTLYPLTASQFTDKPIPPHSQLGEDVLVIPNPEQAAQLADFNRTYYPLNAHCDLTVRLSTFLDPITGYVLYVSEQTLRLA